MTLRDTGHPRTDGAAGVVSAVEPWGCHVATAATATGTFRAAWMELVHAEAAPAPPGAAVDRPPTPAATDAVVGDGGKGGAGRSEPAGHPCDRCGSVNLIRTGTCLTCQDCGENSGCG